MTIVESNATVGRRENSSSSRYWLLTAFGVLGLVLLLAAGFIAAIMSTLWNSDAARFALNRAEASPVVAQSIGTPLKTGWMISGSVNIKNSGGDAELAFPVEGPRGKGILHTTAIRKNSQWQLQTLEFTREGSETAVNLLGDPSQTK